jgi:hypothetical protein
MPGPSPSPQSRADQIRAFQAELGALEAEGVAALDPVQRAAVGAHHAALLDRLDRDPGADTGTSLRQLSLGLKLATLIGTVATAAAVVFFVRQFWGGLPTAGQLALGLAAVLVPLGIAELAAHRGRSLYLGHLFLVVASAGFVVNLLLLHRIFNLPSGPHPWLAFAVFALLLAYRFEHRLLLLGGLLAGASWLASSLYALLGGWYQDFPSLPETMLLPALLLLALPTVLGHQRHPAFSEVYRALGVLLAGLVCVVISVEGALSLLPFGRRGAEIIYTLAGFTLGIGAVIVGVRRDWRQTTNAGTVLALALMVVTAADWWWTLLPRWAFFLVLGALAVASMAGLKRLRALAVAGA